MEMQKVSSEDMSGDDRRERAANESVWAADDGWRDLLSKRETRRATAIVVVVLWSSKGGVVSDKVKELRYFVDQSRTRNSCETSGVPWRRRRTGACETRVVVLGKKGFARD
jgi:hypothetical protein